MGVIRSLVKAVGALLVGVAELLRGLLESVASLFRRLV